MKHSPRISKNPNWWQRRVQASPRFGRFGPVKRFEETAAAVFYTAITGYKRGKLSWKEQPNPYSAKGLYEGLETQNTGPTGKARLNKEQLLRVTYEWWALQGDGTYIQSTHGYYVNRVDWDLIASGTIPDIFLHGSVTNANNAHNPLPSGVGAGKIWLTGTDYYQLGEPILEARMMQAQPTGLAEDIS